MTWSSKSAYSSSSRVALNASTSWWGSLRINPTVSEITTSRVSLTVSRRLVVSRVSKRRLLAGMPAPVRAFRRVDFPALV